MHSLKINIRQISESPQIFTWNQITTRSSHDKKTALSEFTKSPIPPSLSVMWFCSYNEGLKCGSGISSAPSPEPSCSDTHLKIDIQTCIHPLSTSLPISPCPLPLSLPSPSFVVQSRTVFARVLSGCQCLVFCPHNNCPRPLIYSHTSQELHLSVLHFQFDTILWCSSYSS